MRLKAKGPYADFVEVGRAFACAVRESLRKWDDLPDDTIVFAYDTGALEIFEWSHEQGILCVLDQIDPNRVEVELVRDEEKRWPGWTTRATEIPEEYFRRREREWTLADRIMVNSEWSRKALVKQGVPAAKLMVIPLSYEATPGAITGQRDNETNQRSEIGNRKSDQSLRVLFLGQVILRKGIQYLIEAARKLEKENIRFDVVGPIGISPDAVASAPHNLTFHGQVTRDQTNTWYRKADLFVLPTLSDGFAITQLEAMSHGLPVIATPCCGEVVSNGADGFIIPPRDAHALAKTLLRYLAEPELLRQQQQVALAKAKQFTLDHLAENLIGLEAGLENRRQEIG